MGLGLRQLARQARCPRCGYTLAGLDRRATCPECGTDARGRIQFWQKRELFRKGWLDAYWFIAILSGLPFVPLACNAAAGVIWSGVMPWHADYHANLHNGPTGFLGTTAMLTIFGVFFTLMAWPFQFVIFWYLVWLKCSVRLDHRPTVLVWILMAFSLLSPILLWKLLDTLHFPD